MYTHQWATGSTADRQHKWSYGLSIRRGTSALLKFNTDNYNIVDSFRRSLTSVNVALCLTTPSCAGEDHIMWAACKVHHSSLRLTLAAQRHCALRLDSLYLQLCVYDYVRCPVHSQGCLADRVVGRTPAASLPCLPSMLQCIVFWALGGVSQVSVSASEESCGGGSWRVYFAQF
jgi:hypothetical protein